MRISLLRTSHTLVVNLDGRLDEEGANQLRGTLLEADWQGLEAVELDCRGVTFLGSAGIGKLLMLYNQLSTRGVGLRLVNLPRPIFELMQSMRLDQLFTLHMG